MARWKARGRLYIRRNWTFFAISYGWGVMSGNRSKSAFFEGGWVTLSADFRGKGASPTNHSSCQKTRVIAVSCGIKIFAVRCLVLSQYTHLTDGQTDRRTEFRQQYRALHYMQSHGINLTSWKGNTLNNKRHLWTFRNWGYSELPRSWGLVIMASCHIAFFSQRNHRIEAMLLIFRTILSQRWIDSVLISARVLQMYTGLLSQIC